MNEGGTDLFKLGEIPGIVLSWMVTRIVRRGDVRDAFCVHADMAIGIEADHGAEAEIVGYVMSI